MHPSHFCTQCVRCCRRHLYFIMTTRAAAQSDEWRKNVGLDGGNYDNFLLATRRLAAGLHPDCTIFCICVWGGAKAPPDGWGWARSSAPNVGGKTHSKPASDRQPDKECEWPRWHRQQWSATVSLPHASCTPISAVSVAGMCPWQLRPATGGHTRIGLIGRRLLH